MAGMAPESPLTALDTNFLLDLAAGNERCLDAFAALKEVKITPRFVVTPTVLQEVAYFVRAGTEEQKALALKALQSFRTWGITPLTLVPVGHGIVEQIAGKICREGLLPDEEKHDSEIVAEAALTGCSLLVSSDHHLTDMDQLALHRVLRECDVEEIVILGPTKVLRMFGRR